MFHPIENRYEDNLQLLCRTCHAKTPHVWSEVTMHQICRRHGFHFKTYGDTAYWSQRNSKLYDGATSEVLKKQKHSCGHCRLKFGVDERIHLHHIDGNHQNWKNNNLLVVHQSCHQYHHLSKIER